MESLSKLIIKARYLILSLVLVLTLFFGYQIIDIRINSDFIKSLPVDDPIAAMYKEIGEKYQGTDMGMVIIQAENIYTAKLIKDIQQITDSIRVIDGVSTVTSLTDILDIKSDEFGIEITKLVDEYNLPTSSEELQKLKDRVNEKEMYKGSIVSSDGTAAIIMFNLQSDQNQQDIAENIKKKVSSLNIDESIAYGGMPMMMLDISELIISDLALLIPIIILVLIIVLFLSFKSIRGVLFPLLTVGIASIWTIGIMALLDYDITLISGNIPVVLFAIGSAYAIHVVNHLNEIDEKDYKTAVRRSLTYIIIPVFLSAITTVFGFLSFIFGAYLLMIKDFGIFSALGTAIALILSLTLIPSLQMIFPPRKIEKKSQIKKSSFITDKLLNPLHKLLIKHPKYIFIFWSIMILFGIIASLSIERSTNVANYFKDDNSTRISEKLLQEKFGGSSPIYIRIKGDMQSPEVLQKMIELENFVKQNPYVTNANSIADLVKQLNDAMGEGVKIPDDRAKIEQLWFLIDGQDVLSQLVNDDLTEGIIQSRFASDKTKNITPFIQDVNTWIENHPSENYSIEINGLPSVYVQMDASLLRSQLTSLALAVILVFILISLIIGSVKLGFFGIIPILSTVILLFGFMGITGIPLDIATVLVASVAMGIGIDYSVHIINAFNHYKSEGMDMNNALKNTILISGKSIIINVLTVTCGFLVLLFSHIVPMQSFGLLIAISMIFSGLGSLTLLPAILILSNRRKLLMKS